MSLHAHIRKKNGKELGQRTLRTIYNSSTLNVLMCYQLKYVFACGCKPLHEEVIFRPCPHAEHASIYEKLNCAIRMQHIRVEQLPERCPACQKKHDERSRRIEQRHDLAVKTFQANSLRKRAAELYPSMGSAQNGQRALAYDDSGALKFRLFNLMVKYGVPTPPGQKKNNAQILNGHGARELEPAPAISVRRSQAEMEMLQKYIASFATDRKKAGFKGKTKKALESQESILAQSHAMGGFGDVL